MARNGRVVAISLVVVISVVTLLVGLTLASQTAISRPNNEETVGYVSFIGDPVLILGESQNTRSIVERLALSTDNITVTESVSGLSAIGPGDILIIDGEWASQDSLISIAETLKPIILQGTPVLLLNMTSDVIKTALQGESLPVTEVVFGSGDPSETAILAMFNGFIYYPSDGRSASFSLGCAISLQSFDEVITKLYEWAAERN